ncbi:MAG: M81 family metallopeptidase [Pseudomonadota bacterium]
MPRIAIAGFQHETNSLSPRPTTRADFEMADSWPGLLRGADVVAGTRGMNLPIAGFAAAAEAGGATVIPILWCAAEPGGHVTAEAFTSIAADIIAGLRAAGPLDAVYLDLHGAMITDDSPDGEGALLALVRDCVGADVRIAVSLDLHANISPAMVGLSDVICIFRTYPHLDMGQTGARAFARLMACIDGPRPAKALRHTAKIIPVHAQNTGVDPARALYAALPDERDTLVEMALGFTAGQSPDRGTSVVAYAPTDAEAARRADQAMAAFNAAHGAFDTTLWTAEDAIRTAQAGPGIGSGPVVLADVQDNPGAGASSDTTGLLRALVAAEVERALLGLMHDPDVAARAHRAGPGASFNAALGGRSGVLGDAPYEGRFRVDALSDGTCRYSGEMYGGGVATLGPSAVLSLPDAGADIRIVVTSIRNQCLDLAHFTSFGLDPCAADIVAVKSTTHFRAAFEPIARRVIPVRCPGLFPC